MAKLDSLLKGYKEIEAPRESCVERLRIRRQLTAIIPSYGAKVGGMWVKRTYAWDEYTYKIDDFELTIDETLDVLMGRRAAPTIFDPRVIDAAKPPREFASVLGSIEFVPVVQPALFQVPA